MKSPESPNYKHRCHRWAQLLVTTLLVGTTWQPAPTSVAQAQSAPAGSTGVTTVQVPNQASFSYRVPRQRATIEGFTEQVNTSVISINRLVDPLGRITGCAGEILASYQGFSVALYNPLSSDSTGTGISSVVPLTPTEVPDIPGNNIPLGVAPNTQNSNPFFLTDSDQGTYNFLLDPSQGQLDQGRTYILLINPPAASIYDARRIQIVIGARQGEAVAYTATSLDGKPLSATDNRTSVSGTIDIADAERIGLVFVVLDLDASICQSQEIQIIKTGDRAAAEPGDTVIYLLAVKNLSSSALTNVTVTDTLPLGFEYVQNSARGEFNGTVVPITATRNGSTVTFRAEGFTLPPGRTDTASAVEAPLLNIAYAAVLTPDAIRGTGQNSASAFAQRVDNSRGVGDGPATHLMRVRAGIVSDCGTIIGRVFVDKNFDGEQQPGEPGVPNAVIFMDDGNRIMTDINGLFSVANVISGYRTAALDLSSVPGYDIAPNAFVSERNSQSRLVHLEPGGLVRVNFGVTPVVAKEAKP